ncbi:MAG: endonuclease MutS2 [Candidatus Riflebacteria bacterium]|nr:endonuclease MutS2 [Candidatus Riflebacteria bacterium]
MESASLTHLEFEKVLALISGFAGSHAAKDALHELHPSSDREEIEKRLGELDEWMRLFDEGRQPSVGGIREMRDLLKLLHTGGDVLAGEDFLRTRANIDVAIRLRKSLIEVDVERLPLLRRRLEVIPVLDSISERINGAISERGEVRDTATPALSGIRRDLVKSRMEIERRLGEYLTSGSGDMFQDRFFTIRNDRYVIPVKASYQGLVQGIVHDQSGSGQTVFMEPLEFLPLNNRLARLRGEEREEVARILRALTDLLASNRDDLAMLFEGLVFFDVLQARARFARQYEAHRPEIAPDGLIELRSARHPLIHPGCVPVDLTMNRQGACVIITGPNGGGKTVALKILGINALLMQSGNYVLASATSRLPVFEQILTDIGEAQSIENHLSTFTSHLRRLGEILAAAGPRSIALIDEIGVGTDPNEGAALAQGVLKALLRRGAFALVTSHYESLKSLAFITPGFVNAGMEFDYETFRPTFRFLMGVPGRSNALSVARQFGLPDEVLSVMSACLEGKGGAEERLIAVLERERASAEALRRSWEEKEREVTLRRNELEAGLKKIEQFRKSRRDELVETYEAGLKEKVRELEGVIHSLKMHQAQNDASDLETARNALKSARNTISELDLASRQYVGDETSESVPSGNNSDADMFQKGDTVLWKGIPRPAVLEDFDVTADRAVLECNGIRFVAPLSQISRFGEARLAKSASVSGMVIAARPDVSDRLDLRGCRVEEALEKTEAYLKLASSQRLGRVFLVHGKGTGALQRSMHEFLKRSPWRDKFRFGRYGEGDLGVTVVVFDPLADAEKPITSEESRQIKRKKRRD